MIVNKQDAIRTLRSNWFFLAAATVLISDLVVPRMDHWSNPALLEAGVLFDLAFVVPALYLLCYRSRGKAAVLRAVALSCLGIWIASHIVPSEHHHILSAVGFVRYVGLGVLFVIELKLALVIYRSVFSGQGDAAVAAAQAAKDAGMPGWVAKLMAWEASLWRKAWNAVKRLLGRSGT